MAHTISDGTHDPQLDALRALSPGARWEAARQLYWSVRALKAAYLRSVHPDWTDAAVQDAVRAAFRAAAS